MDNETNETAATESTPTAKPKAARKAKPKGARKVDLKKLPPAAHAAAAATLLEKEKNDAAKPKSEREAHPTIEGKLFVVRCNKCGDLKARKFYGDARGWMNEHAGKNPRHAVVIEQRSADKVEKPKRAAKAEKKAAKKAGKKGGAK